MLIPVVIILAAVMFFPYAVRSVFSSMFGHGPKITKRGKELKGEEELRVTLARRGFLVEKNAADWIVVEDRVISVMLKKVYGSVDNMMFELPKFGIEVFHASDVNPAYPKGKYIIAFPNQEVILID